MKFFFLPILILLNLSAFGQLKSPEQFIGYPIGSQFTYHHQVIAYCHYLAEQRKDVAQWISYGKTNEDRELGQMIITSPALRDSLEIYKKWHQEVIQGRIAYQSVQSKLPVIINLSFNVHGNEAAGTEAALETLFYLLGPSSDFQQASKNKRYIILIDPCINPDGREAYVTQFRRRNFIPLGNSDPFDQEHFEGQISGRYNHYFFDLNRDWVWQTQKETKQRLRFFQAWLPMFHADFHEQSYQHSYYFPPAAKPYLKYLSSETKALQEQIGKSFAQVFDQEKWPYFTSEVYDLLYPGYGDTYPILNGALAMTLEQGGIRGGLQAKKSNGDTISLKERVKHHFYIAKDIISWSLVNKESLKSAFYGNHEQARNLPKNEFKSYVIPAKQIEKAKELLSLLKQNRVIYGLANKSLTTSAYSYKEDRVLINQKIEKNDLVISAYQSASPMIQTLLDPQIALEDSVTYDITAWNLFKLHGIEALGLKERIEPKEDVLSSNQGTITWNEQSKGVFLTPMAASFDFAIIQQAQALGIPIVFNDKAVVVEEKTIPQGTLFFLKNDKNVTSFQTWFTNQVAKYSKLTQFSTYRFQGADLGSEHFKYLKRMNVAILTDAVVDVNSLGELLHYLQVKLGIQPSVIPLNQIFKSDLANYTHLIFPNGTYSTLNNSSQVLLNDWVQKGGLSILMEDAKDLVDTKSREEEFKAKKDTLAKEIPYADRERIEISNTLSGNMVQVNVENSHPFMFRLPSQLYFLNQATALYSVDKAWNSLLKTGTNPKYLGFLGANFVKLLPSSSFFAVKEKGKGKFVWFGFNPLFRAIPSEANTILDNCLLYSSY
jgi:hypothetical protein